jgi:hypothetical protein
MTMPKYRFVIDVPEERTAISFTRECFDDNQARMLARGVVVDPNGHAEVWAGTRFVGDVDAAQEAGQAPVSLPTVAEGREDATDRDMHLSCTHGRFVRANA